MNNNPFKFKFVPMELEDFITKYTKDGDTLTITRLDTGGIALTHEATNMIYLLSEAGNGEAKQEFSGGIQ